MYRQEKLNLAARKFGQKDLNRPKSEEDSPSTGQPEAVSTEMENMRFSDHHYMEKKFQCIQKKLGRTAIDATFSVEYYERNVLTR